MTARFISLEGIDGSGKSTQARMLADALRARGGEVILTREPGGSPGAEEIRALVLTGDPGRWSPETEMLLFTAARRDHLERTIRPALARGATVVTDRFADSTRVFQGATRGDLRGMVDAVHAAAIGAEPDLTLVIDADPQEALARSLARLDAAGGTAEDRFERFGLDLQERVRDGFRALAADAPGRVRLIEGTGPVDAVHARVLAAVDAAGKGG
ncbi:MAG: dTMP kinase [Hasllibacter sp.]